MQNLLIQVQIQNEQGRTPLDTPSINKSGLKGKNTRPLTDQLPNADIYGQKGCFIAHCSILTHLPPAIRTLRAAFTPSK